MKIKLESSVFAGKAMVVVYSNDFITEKLKEGFNSFSNHNMSGSIRQTQLNGLCLIMKNILAPKGYSEKMWNDFSFYKIHFELEGHYSYSFLNASKPMLVIPQGHFNMFYLPKAEGTLKYQEKCRKTLEILFTDYFLKKILGEEEYKDFSKQKKGANGENKSFVFWKESKIIPSEIQQVIQEILHCPYSGQVKKSFLESKITGLIIKCLIKPETDRQIKVENSGSLNFKYSGVLKVEEYIRKNLNKPMTIAELAVIAGFNTSKLKQNFKKTFSTTIFKYITKLRMEKAKDLIINEKFSVSEASYEVGYKNPQHFTVAFKKYYGYLPSSLVE